VKYFLWALFGFEVVILIVGVLLMRYLVPKLIASFKPEDGEGRTLKYLKIISIILSFIGASIIIPWLLYIQAWMLIY